MSKDVEPQKKTCPICNGNAKQIYSGLPGYQSPNSYDVNSCSDCGVTYINPMKSDDGIYELIYNNAWRLPGYFEYSIFAEEVLCTEDPLPYLAQVSPVYKFISNYLMNKSNKQNLRILELGSGMGYLTYAISKRGFNITGIDLSQVAVDKANKAYGELFTCTDILKDKPETKDLFDIIICTEVIEHVEKPQSLLKAINSLLKDSGELLMTTPNRDAFPANAVWESDVPPIHLWWFTVESLKFLGKQAGFTKLETGACLKGTKGNLLLNPNRDYTVPKCTPVFNQKGQICIKGNRKFAAKLVIKKILKKVKLLPLAKNVIKTLNRSSSDNLAGSDPGNVNICAVFGK